MRVPGVDIVVPVHDVRRPVERAASSALAGEPVGVRVTVVCHGLDASSLADRFPRSANIRVVEYRDGIRSPAGPLNYGLALADREFVAVLGSDDWLEVGAAERWRAVAMSRGSAAVLAPLRPAGGAVLHNPLVRLSLLPGRGLDPVADRVASRTAPLGLLRRSVVARLGLRFTEGLTTGEDLAFGLRLWFEGGRLDFIRRLPAYVVGDGADDRVTTAKMALEAELAAVVQLREDDWFGTLPVSAKRAIAIKVLRVHLIGAAMRRRVSGSWGVGESTLLADVVRQWIDVAPGTLRPFAQADRDLLQALALAEGGVEGVVAAVARRLDAGRAATILAGSVAANLDRESTLRRYLRYRMW